MNKYSCSYCGESAISNGAFACECAKQNRENVAHFNQGYADAKAGLHMPTNPHTYYADGWAHYHQTRLKDLSSARYTEPFAADEIKRIAVQANVSVDVVMRIVTATVVKMKERNNSQNGEGESQSD